MVRAYVRSLFILVFAVLLALPLAGQAPGDRVQVSYNLPFSSHNQSMWGPPNAPASLDFTVPLFDEGWSNSGGAGGTFMSLGSEWGARLNGATSGRVGMFFGISVPGAGAVNLDYPVRVVLDLPAPNSFRAGGVVTVSSSFEVLDGARLATVPPAAALSVNGIFATHLGADARVCFFGCTTPTLLNFTIPDDPFELFAISSTGTLRLPVGPPLGPIAINTLPYTFGAPFEPFGPPLGLTGPVDAPRVTTTSALGTDGRTLTATGTDPFVDLDVDLDQYLTFVGVPPLGFQSNNALATISGASFGYDVANLALLLDISQRQRFTFAPRVTVTAGFPVPVGFTVLNADGTIAHTGTGTTASFDVGQRLQVTMPSDTRDPLPGTPTYGLPNTFTSSTDVLFTERLVVSAGRFELVMPNASVSREVSRQVCRFLDGTVIDIDLLEDACEFLLGTLATITETVTDVVSIADVNLGPLFSQTLVNESQTVPLFPTGSQSGEWQLAGLQTFTETPFVLDPEDPRIAVGTALSSGVLGGGPAGSIVQVVRVRNEGDVSLSAAQLRDAVAALLSGGGFTVLSVSSPTLVTNPAFDGGAQPDLLGGGNALAPGAEGEVQVVFAVNAGSIYHTSVHAAGTSPIGTNVSADASDALGVVVFEIIPDQVSAWSNGVLPTRVISSGIDAAQIDAAGLRLEGVAPDQWNLTSSGQLTVKFPLPDVLSALDQRILAGIALAPGIQSGAPRPGATLGTLVAAVMNGSGELGELRAVVMAQKSGSTTGGPNVPTLSSAQGASRVLVLTGSLRDGTRLVGEDDLTVMQGGQ